MTIQEKAKELFKHMNWTEINNDPDNKIVVITADAHSEAHDSLIKLTYEVSSKTNLSHDSVYRFTMESLGDIADSEGDRDSIIDIADQIEADYMTSDLTEWLNESNYHVEYLTEAIEEYGAKDGFQALSTAQYLAKREAFHIVLDWLHEQVNTQ